MADFNELIRKDGTRKSISVRDEFYEYIPSENILFESFKYTESVCSQQEFKFGCVEQSAVEFSIANYKNITGKRIYITFYVYAEDGSRTSINLGEFKVIESKKDSNNANIRKVVALTDIDAPLGVVNSFNYITRKMIDYKNYYITPELLVYGSTKNPYSDASIYCRLSNRQVAGVFGVYEDSSGNRYNFYGDARIWENPAEYQGSRTFNWYNSLFFLSGMEINYLSDDVINRVYAAVDEIIAASGLNPPASFNDKMKKYFYNYLQNMQELVEGNGKKNEWLYFIPSSEPSTIKSPFMDEFTMTFNGVTRPVYVFSSSSKFLYFYVYDLKGDKLKNYLATMDLSGIDTSNDIWLKDFRRAWYEITGRISVNRNYGIPDVAAPKELKQSALYPEENLYPSNNLYPDGAELSIYSDSIKKLYVDDEEDVNRFNALFMKFKDANGIEHTLLRPLNKIIKKDVLINGWTYANNNYNGVDIYLEGYTTKKWIMESNVIKIYSDVSMNATIDFLDKDENVIASTLNNYGYYKYITSSGDFEYVRSDRSIRTGYLVFESDKLLDTFIIRIKGEVNKLSTDYIKQHIKIYNELYEEQITPGKTYSIESNICLERFNMDPGNIVYFADMLENKLKNLNYVDISLSSRGLPNYSAGIPIEIVTKDGAYDSYIMRRTISGIQSLTDVIEAK